MRTNDVQIGEGGGVNGYTAHSSPCTVYISLSALIIHVQTLWDERLVAATARSLVL